MNVNLKELIEEMSGYLRDEIKLKPGTIYEYVKTWTRLNQDLDNTGSQAYNSHIGKEDLRSIMGNRYHKDLTTHEKRVFKGIKVLNEYVEKGRIDFWPTPKRIFNGYNVSIRRTTSCLHSFPPLPLCPKKR